MAQAAAPSVFWPKPSYQKKLPDLMRQTRDVSWVADPYTGVEIIIAPTGKPEDPQTVQVTGGTIVACPMFSGLWAIANQAAAARPLGNAAAYVYKLSGSVIYDIKPVTPPADVSGNIYFPPPNLPMYESPDALSAPLDGPPRFVNALYHNYLSSRWYLLSFGTGTSLKTGTGWDNVTGVGSPNGLAVCTLSSEVNRWLGLQPEMDVFAHLGLH